LAGLAVAALWDADFHPGDLHGMPLVAVGETLDGHDPLSGRDGDRNSAGSNGSAWPAPAALAGPEEREAGALPPDDGLGLDDGDGLRPAVPQAGEQDAEQPVRGSQAWTRRGALEDGQLVPQRQIFEHQGASGSEHAEEAGEDEGNHAGHHRSGRPELQC
jgi:hypothetical protein